MIYLFAASVTLLLVGQLNVSYGFICNNGLRISVTTSNRQDVTFWAIPTPEESAQALTDYMAKSHEEKLKAVKAAEEKSKTEIESLKEKINQLESNPSSSAIVNTPPPTPAAGSVEEMSAKLVAYQKFMASYIVNAQEEKIKAIKAAEQAVSKKYEEKLSTFMLSGAAEESAPAAIVVDENAPGSKLYKERNAKVAAAAKAGKSRWGDKEVERVSTAATSKAPTATTKPAVSTPAPTPPEVTAADHGLRADGGVGGLTLAERVALGAESKANGVASPSSEVNGALSPINKMTEVFHQRNAKIAAAAKAGKQSRWGGMEEKKVVELAESTPVLVAATAVVPPEVIAADHGLGTSGPSLAERVNLGASILNSN